MSNELYEATCPDCVEGKITAGCAIDKPLISVDCGRCKGTGKVSLPTIELPFSLDESAPSTPSGPSPDTPIDVTRQHDFVLLKGSDRCGLRGCTLGVLEHGAIPSWGTMTQR